MKTRKVLVTAASLAIAATATAAVPMKLNGPMVAGGNVINSNLQFSPNSSHVLYLADQDTDSMYEIYGVPAAGGTAVKLNGTMTFFGDVVFGGAQFSADSSRVVYVADQDTDLVQEVYSAPSAGGTAVKLNGTLVSGGDVWLSAQPRPDSSQVVYIADQITDEVAELFTVPIAGGTPVKLSGTLVSGGDLASFEISSNSSRVVYRADQHTDEVIELFSVSGAGGAAVKLNGILASGGDVTTQLFTPDASRVLYRADQDADEVYEIYSVPSTGGTVVKLNGALVSGGDVSGLSSMQLSPDSSRVLYRADQSADEVFELYSVPSAGGTAVKLNASMVGGGDVTSSNYRFSPDSTRVFYVADQDADEVYELYSVPSAGGTPVKLNASLVANGDVSSSSVGVQFSPDSSRVLYTADQDTDTMNEIYSVPSAGGTVVKLNGTLVSGGDVTGQWFTPDSSRVIYMADQDTDGVTEIYIVPSTGGTPVKLNGALVTGGTVTSTVVISPDGSRVIYLASQDTVGVVELYARIIEDNYWTTATGNWDTDANWSNGLAPDEVMPTTIDALGTVVMSGPAERSAFSLRVGGTASPVLQLSSDAQLTVHNGLTIAPGASVRGDGLIVGNVTNQNGAEVRVTGGENLRFSGGSFGNAGYIETIGSLANLAQIEFDGALTNASTGQITARNAILRFDGGLTNSGTVTISANQADVFGTITNQAGGKVLVSGSSTAAFYDDLTNAAGSEFRVSTGSTAVFFGTVTGLGAFTGAGTTIFEGAASGGPLAAGTSIVNPGGNLTATSIRQNRLIVRGESIIPQNGTTAATSRLNELVIEDGSLDLNDNDLVLDYAGASPITDIRSYLASGALFSSTANASSTPKFAIGYMENTAGLPTFSGQSVDGTSLLIAYTLRGDSNLDGKVNTLDFNNLAGSFGQTNAFWTNGDFNYDLSVNSIDFNQLIGNYGRSALVGEAPTIGAVVPEPGVAIVLPLLLMCCRRGEICIRLRVYLRTAP